MDGVADQQGSKSDQVVQGEYRQVASAIRLDNDEFRLMRQGQVPAGGTVGQGAPPAARKSQWLAPSLDEQAIAWQALTDRVAQDDNGQPVKADEVRELWREYDHLRAVGSGLPGKVISYQMAVLVVLNLLALVLYSFFPYLQTPTWLSSFIHNDVIYRYLACAYWGATGGCVASLWEIITHALGGRLRRDGIGMHLAKPAVGAILGAVIIQLLYLSYLKPNGADANSAATAFAIATLAGMSERLVIQKVKDVATSLFGSSSGSSRPQSAAEAGNKATAP